MAIPLGYGPGWHDAVDARVELPREAASYLAAAWTPGGADTGPRRDRRALAIPAGLVVRIRAREVAAFESLVHLAYAPLVQFARGFVGSREGAEDVVQDVFASVWERAERWAPSGNPATYLFGMVRHYAIDVVRRRSSESRRYARVGTAMGDDPDPATPERHVLEAEEASIATARLRAIEALLATLSERQRTAYDLRYRQGLTIPEIAQVLGVTAKSAEQLVGRFVRAIRDRMRALEGLPG